MATHSSRLKSKPCSQSCGLWRSEVGKGLIERSDWLRRCGHMRLKAQPVHQHTFWKRMFPQTIDVLKLYFFFMFSFQCCTYSVFKHKKRLVHVLQIQVIKETP